MAEPKRVLGRLAILGCFLLLQPAISRAEPAAPASADDDRVARLAARLEAQARALAAQQARLDAQQRALEARGAELDELSTVAELALAGDDAVAKPQTFRLYGFIDMGVQKLWAADDPVVPSTKSTFVLGNINLYFDFRPAEDWRSLVEVRLTNAPQGAEHFGIVPAGIPYERADTTAPDPANGAGYDLLRWGAVVIERAYIEWARYEKLGIRVGQFLTPYGIWNVDHGTPTRISLYPPEFVSQQLWPRSQVGVQAFGRLVLSKQWQLDYAAYVSNGRTPGVVDLSEQKMVGARVVASTRGKRPLAVGVSAIHGEFVDQQHNIDATGMVERPTTVAYQETGLAADLSLDLGAWRLRAEAVLQHKAYANGHRDRAWLPGVYVADGYRRDVYALLAYRIPRTRLEPFVFLENFHVPTPLGHDHDTISAGVTYYVTPSIQLKGQYLVSRYRDRHAGSALEQSYPQQFLAAKLVMGL